MNTTHKLFALAASAVLCVSLGTAFSWTPKSASYSLAGSQASALLASLAAAQTTTTPGSATPQPVWDQFMIDYDNVHGFATAALENQLTGEILVVSRNFIPTGQFAGHLTDPVKLDSGWVNISNSGGTSQYKFSNVGGVLVASIPPGSYPFGLETTIEVAIWPVGSDRSNLEDAFYESQSLTFYY